MRPALAPTVHMGLPKVESFVNKTLIKYFYEQTVIDVSIADTPTSNVENWKGEKWIDGDYFVCIKSKDNQISSSSIHEIEHEKEAIRINECEFEFREGFMFSRFWISARVLR